MGYYNPRKTNFNQNILKFYQDKVCVIDCNLDEKNGLEIYERKRGKYQERLKDKIKEARGL